MRRSIRSRHPCWNSCRIGDRTDPCPARTRRHRRSCGRRRNSRRGRCTSPCRRLVCRRRWGHTRGRTEDAHPPRSHCRPHRCLGWKDCWRARRDCNWPPSPTGRPRPMHIDRGGVRRTPFDTEYSVRESAGSVAADVWSRRPCSLGEAAARSHGAPSPARRTPLTSPTSSPPARGSRDRSPAPNRYRPSLPQQWGRTTRATIGREVELCQREDPTLDYESAPRGRNPDYEADESDFDERTEAIPWESCTSQSIETAKRTSTAAAAMIFFAADQ